MRGLPNEDDVENTLREALADAACYLEKASDVVSGADPGFAATLLRARDRARAQAGEDAVIRTRINVQTTAEKQADQQKRDAVYAQRAAQGKD